MLRLMLRHLVINYVNRREKQQRNFRAAAHHQWRVVHLHAVINPHAGRNDAQNAEQEGQTVCALVLIQQKHEYKPTQHRQRGGRVWNNLQGLVRARRVHPVNKLQTINFN
jgi:hypothetical protein